MQPASQSKIDRRRCHLDLDKPRSQRRQPASAKLSESCWRIDSSTVTVDEPTRQRCAVHQLATQAAATRSRRGGAIKRREKPLSFEIPAILTPGICAGRSLGGSQERSLLLPFDPSVSPGMRWSSQSGRRTAWWDQTTRTMRASLATTTMTGCKLKLIDARVRACV